ncbi:MlaD family protein [Nocardia callitridis]|uniref:MlaD family protein n=1 Tax=Nocardia callitridis TaxID=648753 RepID=UPI0031ECE4BB
MLSRFVRAQLVIFGILSVIGVVVMAVVYMSVPTLLGVGTMQVTVELPAAGGLYRFGNVTYRGAQVGKVTAVDLRKEDVRVELSIDNGFRIPSDLQAQVRSVSAVGEQYVELLPRTDSPPYLHNGSVIDARDTVLPQPVGPMLDKLSALVNTIPQDKLHELLDEMYKGVNGTRTDLDSLMNSASTLAADMNGLGDTAKTLTEDSVPLLDSQVRSTDAIDLWSRSMAGITGQLVTNDPQLRTVLRDGPQMARESEQILDQVKLTLPVLLANLTTIGQLGVTYHAGLEQVLVLLPPIVASTTAYQPTKNSSGLGLGAFRMSGTSDPPACTVGFLPPTEWRPPSDTTTIDTPDGLYCKLPQDSPVAVRGARNYPCMNDPGKRAATAEVCNNEQESEQPVATEQPVVGPYPRDPNLESQGIAPDVRPIPGDGSGPPLPGREATPSAYRDEQPQGPSVATAGYDPKTGRYLTPDGQLFQQSDLVSPGDPGTWRDMIPH